MKTVRTPIKLDVYREGILQQTVVLDEPTIKIGRLSSAHLRVDHRDVCRMHALIEVKGPDAVHLLDLGSAHGTYLNGEKVVRAALQTGDRMTLGPFTIVCTLSGARNKPATVRGPLFDETEDPGAGRTLEVIAQWGKTVVDVQHLDQPGAYVIGEGRAVNHFADVDALPTPEYTLAERDGEMFTVNIPDAATGEVLIDGRVISLARLRTTGQLGGSTMPSSRSLCLPARGRCRLHIGELHFLVNSVPLAGRIKNPPLLATVDRQFFRHLGGALGLHAAFLLMIFSIPEAAGSLTLDGVTIEDHFVNVSVHPLVPEPEPVIPGMDEARQRATDLVNEGALATRKVARDRAPVTTPKPASRSERVAQARAVAESAMGQLDAQLTRLLTDSNALDTAGLPLIGTPGGAGSSGGPPALAATGGRGTCTDTGCDASLTAGPVSMGPGQRKSGRDAVTRLGPKSMRQPEVILQPASVSGPLPMSVIARIMRRNQNGFRYCYEKRLNQAPELAGKVRLEFFIGTDGKVAAARVDQSTMGDDAVESCLVKRLKRIQFPKRGDAGTVLVRYPFLFRAG